MSEFILPGKPDIERLVLGAVLIRGERFEGVRQCIARDDFTSDKHRALFDAFESLHAQGRGIDRVTVYHEAARLRPGIWSLGDLADLDNELPEVPCLDAYLGILADIGTRRRAIFELSKLAHALSEGSGTQDALRAAQRVAGELSGALGSQGHLRDVANIVEAAGGLEAMMRPHEMAPATPMPWAALSRIFAGLEPGRITLLAARPGDGKTTAALQILHDAAALGKRVALFSLEMGGPELLHRLACIVAGVPLQKFLRGYATRDEERIIARALGGLATMPLSIDDSNAATVPAIRRAIMRAKQRPDVLVVDYLQLMTSTARSGRRYEDLGEITRGLKILAREMDVSILAMSQLTRNNEHEKRPPELRDLRESGSLEQDADNVLMLHHVAQGEQRGTDHPVKVLVRKQRMGPLGEATLLWNARVARFEEPTAADRWDSE